MKKGAIKKTDADKNLGKITSRDRASGEVDKASMTDADFKYGMKKWATKYKIPDDQRDKLIQWILTYENAQKEPDYKLLVESDFAKVIDGENDRRMYSLKKDPSAETIKDQIWALQKSLGCLSIDAKEQIDFYLFRGSQTVPADSHYIRLLMLQSCDKARRRKTLRSTKKVENQIWALQQSFKQLSFAARELINRNLCYSDQTVPRNSCDICLLMHQSCERAHQEKMKEGRQRPAGRIKFIKSLYSDFERITGREPKSTPEGCFCEMVGLALDRYGLTIDSISREVQKHRQYLKDIAYLGLPPVWDPDFCFSTH